MPGKKTWHTHSILTHTNKDSWMFVLFCYFPFFHCIRDGFFLQFIYWLLFSSLSFCCSVFSFCFTCFFFYVVVFSCVVCVISPLFGVGEKVSQHRRETSGSKYKEEWRKASSLSYSKRRWRWRFSKREEQTPRKRSTRLKISEDPTRPVWDRKSPRQTHSQANQPTRK